MKNSERFIKDCEAAGLVVSHYEGRNFYKGPAVRTDVLPTVFQITNVDCRWDEVGYQFVVYPKYLGDEYKEPTQNLKEESNSPSASFEFEIKEFIEFLEEGGVFLMETPEGEAPRALTQDRLIRWIEEWKKYS